MSDNLEKLVRKRAAVKGNLTRFKNFVDNLDTENPDLVQLELRFNKLNLCWQAFDQIQAEIEVVDDTLDHDIERQLFENDYFTYEAKAKNLLNSRPSSGHDSGASERGEHSDIASNQLNILNNIKLPTINLPGFDGQYSGWLYFKDTFISIVHNNTVISNVQKFHYLRSCLKGEAADIISSLEVSSENYNIAWQLINERYENKTLLTNNHVKGLFNLPTINKESHFALRSLLDNLNKHLRALNVLGQPVQHWDTLIIHMVSNNLDPCTRREWESKNTNNKLPTLAELIKFLNDKCSLLETLNTSNSHQKSKTKSFVVNNNYTLQCKLCSGDHYISKCERFLNLSPNKRYSEIKSRGLCSNCLKSGHSNKTCTSSTCKKCTKRHHTLLHFNNVENKNFNATNNTQGEQTTPSTSVENKTCQIANADTNQQTLTHFTNTKGHTLLCTAVVQVFDKYKNPISCRAVLDSASESHFVTNELADKLQTDKFPVNVTVSGINKCSSQLTHTTNIKLKSNSNNFETSITCLIIPRISDNLPSVSFDISCLNIPSEITLADPYFNDSDKIDLLIGAELFWRLIRVGQINLGKKLPVLQNTVLGWVVSGEFSQNQFNCFSVQCNFISTSDLDNKLTKFWELEEKITNVPLSPEEQRVEEYFQATTQRSSDGKFIVRLPLKQSPNVLGESRQIALKRLYSIENKLSKNENLQNQYSAFMQEYCELNHMSKISEIDTDNAYYIPHHFVKKENSLTTQLRIVFDASSKTSTGISLNDIMMVGGKLQQDLFSIISRFRLYKWVLAGDVSKMYRQVWVHPDDRKLQRILWRENPADPVECYELQTVTYGTASAPYLAVRSLNEAAYQNIDLYPNASNKILTDFYVDDILTGSDNVDALLTLYKDICNILNPYGFKLNKWISNNSDILSYIVDSNPDAIVNIGNQDETHSLGLLWKSKSDSLMYNIKQIHCSKNPTKRLILSSIAQIFDPLGLVGPVIVRAKIFMQRLWQLRVSWDDSLPLDIANEWLTFSQNLNCLNQVQVPRYVSCNCYIEIELHGFADASQRAFGCCIYIRTTDNFGNHAVNLLCARSRVAPLKPVTTPRLELCAAVLLAELFNKVKSSLNIEFNNVYLWSDSTIVLAWIKSIPSNYKIFVANRISEIQTLTNTDYWHYISTYENPADIISRGISPQDLIHNQLWWHGPNWLNNDVSTWPLNLNFNFNIINGESELKTKNLLSAVTVSNAFNIFGRYSSLIRLQRVVAYMLRFINNVRPTTLNFCGVLTPSELEASLIALIKVVQAQAFSGEISSLKNNKVVDKHSKLLNLDPFIDELGLVRVGGRLKNSQFSYDKKHPIALPNKHNFCNLLVNYEHQRLLHAGPQLLLASLRERFWIISARRLVRKIVHECTTCFRVKPIDNVNYLMADLPSLRVTPSRPFINCGIDYCGPFNLRDRKTRNFKLTKAYVCVIICFATKAAHLELVSSLSSDAFLACLHRFMSRRGKCSNIYSDNGTNFVGANAEIQRFLKSVEGRILAELGQEGINWHFVPPRSPHFGGLWEAGVKSVKHHLRRVVGETSLTYEEFNTVLIMTEACLNSRPMYPFSDNPNDLTPLTPGHFLIGQSLTSIPCQDLTDVKESQLSRFKRCQKMAQDIWTRWSKEYVSELQIRSKWKTRIPELLKVDSLVIIKEDKLPPLKWNLGRVLLLHPGIDGIVRVVTVKTSTGTYKRPVTKLCVLPSSQ